MRQNLPFALTASGHLMRKLAILISARVIVRIRIGSIQARKANEISSDKNNG